MTGLDIRTLRKQLRLSQRQFADELGVSQKTVWFWESGKSTPNAEYQAKLDRLRVVKSEKQVVNLETDVVKEVVKNDEEVVNEVVKNEDEVVKGSQKVVNSEEEVVKNDKKGSQEVVNDDEKVVKNDTSVSSEQENVSSHDTNDTTQADTKSSKNVSSPDTTFPSEMVDYNHWVCWKTEMRDKEINGKKTKVPTKVPYSPHGGKAETNNPSTWDTLEQAQAHLAKNNDLEGIGYVFADDDPFCGIDLDKCGNPDTGEIDADAQKIINDFASYTEISPSEEGTHTIIKGKKKGKKARKGKIEIYDSGRYFTMTGNVLDGYTTIENRQEQLDALYDALFAKEEKKDVPPKQTTVSLDDQELIEKAKNAKDGAKFTSLWDGDISGYDSHSEADLALCSLLAFWTGGDYGRIDRLFRQSGLYRDDKWEREDYRERTIKKAIAEADFYDPQYKDVPDTARHKKSKEPAYIHLTDIEKSEYEGQSVITDVLLPGVGRDDSFFVPKKVVATCEKEDKSKCDGCPLIEEGLFTKEFADDDRRLIRFTRQTDEQVRAEIRKALGLPKKCSEYKFNIEDYTEMQILLAVPKAGAELRKEGGKFVDEHGRDFREKVIYYSGVVPRSNAYYETQGTVVADPKSQRATMLVDNLIKLQNEYERFTITEDTKALLKAFQAEDDSALGIDDKMRELSMDIAYNTAGYFGEPRVNIVIADMLTWHSVLQFPFDGDMMAKGWIDLLIFGDSGINKTMHLRKLRSAINFGYFVDGGAVSRAGLLYSLDDIHSGIRILRWGALPLNDGQLVIVDEAQNITQDVWQEMSSARTTGLLTVTKAKQGEHPMRTRQIYTSNPKPPNTMASFSFPIRGIKDLMRPADMRRFDIVICAARGEVEVSEVNRLQAERGEIVPHRITPEYLKASIARAWTRRPEHIIWSDGAEAAVMDMATKLQKKYGCGDLPVIDIDAKDKVARGAVAIATMLISTDERFETVIVKPEHAHWIGMYLSGIYSAQAAMLDKHAQVASKMEHIADLELDIILQEWQKLNPPEPEHLAEMAILIAEGEGIERDVLAAQVGVTPQQISTLIQKFKQHRFVKSTRKGYYATPRLVAFYRAKYDELSDWVGR